jgi:AcrR family transcriptional regulator
MRRTKEDMLVTRQQIIDAGFDCFFEKGYEATSLVEVADRAGVTRGAIYWHFSNKLDLYHAVIDMVLQYGDVAQYFNELPVDMALEDRLYEIFWKSLGENRYVDFVFKTLAFTIGRSEFSDIYEQLAEAKRKLMQSFKLEVSVYVRMHSIQNADEGMIATALYLLFEGLFLTKNVPIGISISRSEVERHIHLILSELRSTR